MRYYCLILTTFLCAVSTAAYSSPIILENFVGASCDVQVGHQENVNVLTDFHDDVFTLTCPMDEGLFEGSYAHDACKIRKRGFLANDLYTGDSPPVVVINGNYMTSGGYHKIVNSAVNMARTADDIKSISLMIDNDQITGELPSANQGGDYELWLFAYDSELISGFEMASIPQHQHNPDGTHVDPALNDNEAAHTPVTKTVPVEYRNVVKKLEKLGDWDGLEGSFVIPLNGYQADGYAILAQEKNHGPVVAFGKLDWPSNLPNQ